MVHRKDKPPQTGSRNEQHKATRNRVYTANVLYFDTCFVYGTCDKSNFVISKN